MNYIIFDLEWNQPSNAEKSDKLQHGEIIQIGFVLLDSGLEIKHREELTIRPVVYKTMNAYVSTLTGITQKDINAGMSFAEAFGIMSSYFTDDTALITWGDDDIPVLRENLAFHGISKDTLPVHYNLQRIFAAQTNSHLRQTGLKTAAESLGITDEIKAHDALNDAYLTYLIAKKLDLARGMAEYAEAVRIISENRPPWEDQKPLFTAKNSFNKNPSGMAAECRRIHFCCPLCGKDFVGVEPVRQSKSSFVSTCECGCRGKLFLRFTLKDGYIRISAFGMTEAFADVYNSRLKVKEKREKRRALFAEAARNKRRQKDNNINND